MFHSLLLNSFVIFFSLLSFCRRRTEKKIKKTKGWGLGVGERGRTPSERRQREEREETISKLKTNTKKRVYFIQQPKVNQWQ